MKPFNLKEALEGKPVITRDGREVTQLHEFKTSEKYSLFGVIDNRVYAFANSGIFDYDASHSDYDLFMAPIKTKYYVHVVKYNGLVMSFTSTNNQLDKDVLGERLETFEFEIDE